MKSLGVFLAMCLICLGCGNRLTAGKAKRVLEENPTLRTLAVGNLLVHIGEETSTYECGDDNPEHEPYDVKADRAYVHAGLLLVSRPSNCLWMVRLASWAQHDLQSHPANYEPQKAELVLLKLNEFDQIKIEKVVQEEKRAIVDAVFVFRFTETMKHLSKQRIYPQLEEKDCSYDLPNEAVECKAKMNLAFFEGAWRIDPSNDKSGI